MIEAKERASSRTPDQPLYITLTDVLTFKAKAEAWRKAHPLSKPFRVPKTRIDELLQRGRDLGRLFEDKKPI